MGRLEQVLDVVVTQIKSALNAANLLSSTLVFQGWPVPGALTKVMNQGGAQISVYPCPGGRLVPPRLIQHQFVSVNPQTLTVAVSGPTATFSGSVAAGTAVYAYVGHPHLGTQIVSYTANANDTLVTVAAALVSSINGLSPVSASASGNAFTVSGAYQLGVNVLTTGSMQQEVMRIEQPVQVSTWTPTPVIRAALIAAFQPAIGTQANPFLDLGDGSPGVRFIYRSYYPRDDSQSDYNVYESHTMYALEYSVLATSQTTSVGEVVETFSLPNSNANFVQNVGE